MVSAREAIAKLDSYIHLRMEREDPFLTVLEQYPIKVRLPQTLSQGSMRHLVAHLITRITKMIPNKAIASNKEELSKNR